MVQREIHEQEKDGRKLIVNSIDMNASKINENKFKLSLKTKLYYPNGSPKINDPQRKFANLGM